MPKVAALLLLCSTLAHTQPMIAGRVVDRLTGLPLARVAVELIATTSEAVLDTAVTTDRGLFTLVAPRAGAYRVRFSTADAGTHVSDSLVVGDGEYLAREFPVNPLGREFSETDVDRGVLIVTGSAVPHYPDDLRAQRISGCVIASFVVDTTGRADRGTLRILRSSDHAFVRAVWDAMPQMRFEPAEINGRKVAQRVVQPYTFTIVRGDQLDCVTAKPRP
jgi:TonB family protein